MEAMNRSLEAENKARPVVLKTQSESAIGSNFGLIYCEMTKQIVRQKGNAQNDCKKTYKSLEKYVKNCFRITFSIVDFIFSEILCFWFSFFIF